MALFPCRFFRARVAAGLLCVLLPAAGFAQAASIASSATLAPDYASDLILIQPRPGTRPEALADFHAAQKGKVLWTFEKMGRLQVVSVPEGETVPGLVAKYQQSGLVEFAEPDYIARVTATPNDPKYVNGTLWGLNKIEAPAAWNVLTTASNIVIAVLDTGVRYTHEDLKANMWTNPVGGGYGLNGITGSNDPSDDNGHGTMVAGVLGAVGNNGKGVVGVAWQVRIMACKCFDSFGRANNSAILTCLDFARTNGARLINASWGTTNSLALSNAIYSLRDDGIILVTASGNSTNNLDINPTYPASYHLDNVVSVAYTTTNDLLAVDSNYGATSVHLAAPGQQIYSTFGATDGYYYTMSGTSFAAPYVTGALSLMLAEYPTATYQQLIGWLLNTTDPLLSLAGKCATGGRLNLHKALTPIRLTGAAEPGNGPFHLRVDSITNLTCVLQASANLAGWSPVFTNTTSLNNTFDFPDYDSTNYPQRFYRAVVSP